MEIQLQTRLPNIYLENFYYRDLYVNNSFSNSFYPSLSSSYPHAWDFLLCSSFYMYTVTLENTCFLVIHVGGCFWLQTLYTSYLISVKKRIFIDAMLKLRLGAILELADAIGFEVPDGHVASNNSLDVPLHL